LQLEDEIQRLVSEACQKVVEEQAQGLGVGLSVCCHNIFNATGYVTLSGSEVQGTSR
jgi:hypothetical protein